MISIMSYAVINIHSRWTKKITEQVEDVVLWAFYVKPQQ